MRGLLDRYLGQDWWRSASEPATWQALDAVPDGELWEARREERSELVEFVKDRSGIDRLAGRQPRPGIEAAARAFDPDVLTIGFARRTATWGSAIICPKTNAKCLSPLPLLGRPARPICRHPSLSTSGETLTIEESMTLRARTENAGHVGDEHEWSWSCA
jgi:starch phosphorylase